MNNTVYPLIQEQKIFPDIFLVFENEERVNAAKTASTYSPEAYLVCVREDGRRERSKQINNIIPKSDKQLIRDIMIKKKTFLGKEL